MKSRLIIDSMTGSDVERAMARLSNVAKLARQDPGEKPFDPFEGQDRDSVKKHAEDLLDQGWTVNEVVSYLSKTEEVDPSLDEESALASMNSIRKQVAARLQK